MKVICDKCGAAFRVNEQRIRKGGSKARCMECGHMISVYPPGSAEKISDGKILDDAEKAKTGKSGPVKGAVSKPGILKPPSTKSVSGYDQSEKAETGRADLKNRRAEKNRKEKISADTALQIPPVFRVVGGKNCPLYTVGDEFQLAGNIFSVPANKAPCMTLAKDIVNLLKGNVFFSEPQSVQVFRCSGCRGMIRFSPKQYIPVSDEDKECPEDDYLEVVTQGLSGFPVFQALDDHVSREFASSLRFDEFSAGELIIKKGDPGRNLYIIITGRVEVLGDDEMRIVEMGRGDVFGEMSLLSGNTVGATIKALEPTTVLYITARNLKTILSNSPSLQMYFTRLLAGRMAEINQARYEEFSSGVTGKISEMIPSELFQIFHMNQKTGILNLQASESKASVAFRDGEVVRVHFDGKEGREAFFDLLKLKRGRFRFSPGLSLEEMELRGLGEFMPLLMEGLRRIDEDEKQFLRMVIPKII